MAERINTPFTNEHFAAYCLKMVGQPYWYGCCGYKAKTSLLSRKAKQYPSHYTASRMSRYKQDIRDRKVVCDCIGGAKGYAWTNGGQAILDAIGTDAAVPNKYGANGCPDKGANSMFAWAKAKGMDWGTIDTLPEIVGLALHTDGHVGYYVGNGYAVEWRGFSYGSVRTKVKDRKWKYWYKLPFIQYREAVAENTAPEIALGSRLLKRGMVGSDTYLKSSYVYNNDATCYKDGTKTAKCIWYGENGCAATTTDTATGTKTPHDFTHATYTPVSEPTCTRNRRLIGYCAYYDGNYCKMSGIREEAGTALGRDYAGQEYLPYTAATCTQNATERALCVRFGKDGCNSCDVRELENTATGHSLVNHEAKAATCTTVGWNAYQACSKCDYTTCVEIPAGHDLVHHEAKDATCTSIGWNAYDTCTRCDYTTFAELPAGHDLEHFERKRATCTEGGWNAHDTCKRCGYTTKKETNPLFHDMSEYVSDGNGKTHTRTCRREGCGATDTRDCFGDRRASCV